MTESVQIGIGECWLAIATAGDRLDLELRGRGLTGAWRTEPVDLQQAARRLSTLHETLKGEAWLGDTDSFAITFKAGSRGQVTADVHVLGWPFQMEGHLDFDVEVDHAQLYRLARQLEGAAR